MRTPKLQDLTDDELVERFKQLSFQQGAADSGSDMRMYRRCYDRLNQISDELKRRGPGARRALIPLLICSAGPWELAAAAQCHYNAARDLLAVEPARARATLEELAANSVTQSQMAQARRTLEVLNDGTFKPT